MDRVLFPSLSAENNLPSTLRDHAAQLTIMTRAADVDRIRDLRSLGRLATLLPTGVVAQTSAASPDAPQHIIWWHAAIERAKSCQAVIIVIHPDTLWADGALKHICDAVDHGKKAVLMPPNIRVISETVRPPFSPTAERSTRLQKSAYRAFGARRANHDSEIANTCD